MPIVGDKVILTTPLYYDDGTLAMAAGAVGEVEDIFEDGDIQIRISDGTPHDAVHWVKPQEIAPYT